jgi:glycosyltransferase involved in cell wall biosynthesis
MPLCWSGADVRVTYLINNLYPADGVGNSIVELSRYFLARNADFLIGHVAEAIPPDDLAGRCVSVTAAELEGKPEDVCGPAAHHFWNSDLVLVDYAVYHELADAIAWPHPGFKILVYHGLTPLSLWQCDIGRLDLSESHQKLSLARAADFCVVASDSARRELVMAGIDPAKIVLMPYCVRGDRFHPRPRDLRLERLWGLRDHFVLLYAGRMAQSKRIPWLIRAFAAARASGLPLKLLLVGNDHTEPYRSQARLAQQLADELGVGRHIVFAGSVGEDVLPFCFNLADVYVSASVHEAFGIPLVEAMASGKAVVAARAASVPEVVGDAGRLVDPDRPEAMAEAVIEILSGQTAEHLPQKPPRLCFVTPRYGPGFSGGAEALCRFWAEACHKAGWTVKVVTTTSDSMVDWSDAFPTGTTTLDGVLVERFPTDRGRLAEHFRLHHRISQDPASVSMAEQHRWAETGIAGPLLLRHLEDCRSSFDFFLFAPYLFNTFLSGHERVGDAAIAIPCLHDEAHASLEIVRRSLDRCRAIFFNTKAEADLALGKLGVTNANCFTIGMGISADVPGDPVAFRTKFGIAEDFLLYCGRLEDGKNVRWLLDCFRRYNCGGTILSCQEDHKQLLKLVAIGGIERSSQGDVIELGYLSEEDKRNALAACLALVNPSLNESFSIVLMEAWSQGRPVLVHDRCPITAGHVNRCGGGFTFADHAAFAHAIDVLRADPREADRRGQLGRAYVIENYEPGRLFQRFQECLDLVRTETPYERLALRAVSRARTFNHASYCQRWDAWLAQHVEERRSSDLELDRELANK